MKLIYKMMGISKKDLFNSSNWCESCTRAFHYGSMFRKVDGCCFENGFSIKYKNNLKELLDNLEKRLS